MSPSVLVAGASVVDRFIALDHLPREGVTEVGDEALVCPGGKGLNQAVGLARLGLKVHFVTAVGNDPDGRWMAAQLRREGLNPPLKVRSAPTGFSNILVDSCTGRHVLATFRGANHALRTSHLPRRRWDGFAAGLFQWEVDDRVNRHLAHALARAGKPVILNPAPVVDPALLDRWLPLSPLVTPNEIEAAALTGLSRRAAPAKMVRQMRKRGFLRGVITLGARGCYWWEDSGEGRLPARRVRAVDCVGAGDSFNAGLVKALLGGRSLPQACRFALRCAAFTVSRPGTMAALPRLADLR